MIYFIIILQAYLDNSDNEYKLAEFNLDTCTLSNTDSLKTSITGHKIASIMIPKVDAVN